MANVPRWKENLARIEELEGLVEILAEALTLVINNEITLIGTYSPIVKRREWVETLEKVKGLL